MKFKQYVYNMKLKLQWPLLLESVVHFFAPILQFLRRLYQFLQFSRCSLGEICSQHLTRSPYIDLEISK